MRAKVFKSLTKPVFWGGLPRELFIFLFMFGLLSIMIFHPAFHYLRFSCRNSKDRSSHLFYSS